MDTLQQAQEIARRHGVRAYCRDRMWRNVYRPALLTVGISVPSGILLGFVVVYIIGFLN